MSRAARGEKHRGGKPGLGSRDRIGSYAKFTYGTGALILVPVVTRFSGKSMSQSPIYVLTLLRDESR
jgi:hypothetical protein